MLERRRDLFEPFMELQKEVDRIFNDFMRPARTD